MSEPLYEQVRAPIAAALAKLEELFEPEVRLTFIARHPGKPDAYVIVSRDSQAAQDCFEAIVEALP